MTYATFLKVLRTRILPLKTAKIGGVNIFDADDMLFTISNDAVRRINLKTKDKMTSASLSITAGTGSYTISTAIGTDVDEIFYILLGTEQISPRNFEDYREIISNGTADEQSDSDYVGTPKYFTVYNGTLYITPTPTESDTATVYYTKREASMVYGTTYGSTSAIDMTISLRDDYIEALMYDVMSIIYEMAGEYQQSAYFMQKSLDILNEARANQPNYSSGSQVQYQDGIN